MPTALITGITGQDGSHLAEFLLSKDYRVSGLVRRSSGDNCQRLTAIRDRINLYQGGLLDQTSLIRILEQVQPDEVYNLAGMSFVAASWQQPVLTGEFTALGVTRLLDALRQACPEARFFQASSSEMFGKPSVSFAELVRMMVDADLALLARQEPEQPMNKSRVPATRLVEQTAGPKPSLLVLEPAT